MPFIDQMLDRLVGHPYLCFLDGYSGYNQIVIAPKDEEKTTFTCPYGTFVDFCFVSLKYPITVLPINVSLVLGLKFLLLVFSM